MKLYQERHKTKQKYWNYGKLDNKQREEDERNRNEKEKRNCKLKQNS